MSPVLFFVLQRCLCCLPDAKGLRMIDGNSSVDDLCLQCQEFLPLKNLKIGIKTNDKAIYHHPLQQRPERSPDKAGLANYQNLLANGKTRGALLLDFSESPETAFCLPGHRVGLTRIITHLKQLIHEPIFSTFRRLVGNPHREDIQKDDFACKRLRNVYIYQKQISE